jgi:hypothetical protein
LRKAGIPVELSDGPNTLAQRAKQQRPDLAESIEQITAIFIRLRYEAKADLDDLQALKSLVGSLRV